MAGEKHLSQDGVSADDRHIFRQAVADVQPLSSNRAVPQSHRPSPIAQQSRKQEQQVRDELASGQGDPFPIETGEEAFWCRRGIQHRVQRRLRKGQIPVEAVLDLHGMRVEEARSALGAFLHYSVGRGRRCIRIIHGKGRRSPNGEGVLRHQIQWWLVYHWRVLGFASCLPSDGGTGALYVLLKK